MEAVPEAADLPIPEVQEFPEVQVVQVAQEVQAAEAVAEVQDLQVVDHPLQAAGRMSYPLFSLK